MKKNYLFFSVLALLVLVPNISYGMHVMEGFLPVGWCVFWAVLSLPFLVFGLRKLKQVTTDNIDAKLLLGLVGGFAFVLSALKIPSVTGSCSHPTGVGLGAILFGPTIMTVIGTIVLLFQAILLAHGGLTTLGANVFSMGIIGPFVSYGIFRGLKNKVNKKVAVFLASALGNLATYCITSLELALAFPDPVGGVTASLTKFLLVFALTQIPLAIAEGLLTVIVYNLMVEYKEKGVLKLGNI